MQKKAIDINAERERAYRSLLLRLGSQWSRSSNSIHIYSLSTPFEQIDIWIRNLLLNACVVCVCLNKIFYACVKGETTTVKLLKLPSNNEPEKETKNATTTTMRISNQSTDNMFRIWRLVWFGFGCVLLWVSCHRKTVSKKHAHRESEKNGQRARV